MFFAFFFSHLESAVRFRRNKLFYFIYKIFFLVEWVSKVVPLFPPAPAAEGGVVYRNEFITNLNRRKFYIPRVRTDLQFSIHLVKRMRKRIDLLYLFFLTNETRWLASEAAEFLIERSRAGVSIPL